LVAKNDIKPWTNRRFPTFPAVERAPNRMNGLDAAIVIVYLAAVFSVGLWVSRGQTRIADYLLGGRNLPWWAVLFSIVATESSIVTFFSVPGLVTRLPQNPNSGGFQFLQLPLGFILGRYLVAYLLLPAYFRGELYTAYQVLEKRFGGGTQRVASALFLVMRNLADGLRLYLAASFLQLAFQTSLNGAIVAVGAATLVYTYFGGVRAVIWTECAQFAIKLLGTAVAGWIAFRAAGGWEAVRDFGFAHGSFTVFDLGLDPPFAFLTKPYTLACGILGGAFLSLSSHGVDQMMVQRYLCAGTQRAAARAIMWSGWIVLLLFAGSLTLGLGLASYFDQHPPLHPFTKNDEVFLAFLNIHDLMPPGLMGLITAAVLSAAMATLSSSLNASAGTVVADWIMPLRGWSPESRTAFSTTKAMTLVFGCVQIGVAILGQNIPSVVGAVFDIAAFTSGVVLGLFFLGAFTTVRQQAALYALVIALAGMCVLKQLTPLAGPWYALVGSIGTLMLGLLIDRLTPRLQGERDAATVAV
jgi:SSS family transporter